MERDTGLLGTNTRGCTDLGLDRTAPCKGISQCTDESQMSSTSQLSQRASEALTRVPYASQHTSESHMSSFTSHSRDVMLSEGHDNSLFDDILSSSQPSGPYHGTLLASEQDFNSESSQESKPVAISEKYVNSENCLNSNPSIISESCANTTRCSEWKIEHANTQNNFIFEDISSQSFDESNILPYSDLVLIAKENDIVIIDSSEESSCSDKTENIRHDVESASMDASLSSHQPNSYSLMSDNFSNVDKAITCYNQMSLDYCESENMPPTTKETCLSCPTTNIKAKSRIRSDSSSPLGSAGREPVPSAAASSCEAASRVFFKPSVIIHHHAQGSTGASASHEPAQSCLGHSSGYDGYGAQSQYWMRLYGHPAVDMNSLFSKSSDASHSKNNGDMVTSTKTYNHNVNENPNEERFELRNSDISNEKRDKSATESAEYALLWKPPPVPTRVISNVNKCCEIDRKMKGNSLIRKPYDNPTQRELALLQRIEAEECLRKVKEDVIVRSRAIEASRIEYFNRCFVEGKEKASVNKYFDSQLNVLLDWAEKAISAQKSKIYGGGTDHSDKSAIKNGLKTASKTSVFSEICGTSVRLGNSDQQCQQVQPPVRYTPNQNLFPGDCAVAPLSGAEKKNNHDLTRNSSLCGDTVINSGAPDKTDDKVVKRPVALLTSNPKAASQRRKWSASKSNGLGKVLEEDRRSRMIHNKVAKNLMNVFDDNRTPTTSRTHQEDQRGDYQRADQTAHAHSHSSAFTTTSIHVSDHVMTPSYVTSQPFPLSSIPVLSSEFEDGGGVIVSISKLSPERKEQPASEQTQGSGQTGMLSSDHASGHTAYNAYHHIGFDKMYTGNSNSQLDFSSECNQRHTENHTRHFSPVNYDGFLDTTSKCDDVFLNADLNNNQKTPKEQQTLDLSTITHTARRSSASSVTCNIEKSCEFPVLLNPIEEHGNLKADLSLGFDLVFSHSLQADDNIILLPGEEGLNPSVEGVKCAVASADISQSKLFDPTSLNMKEFAHLCFADASDNEQSANDQPSQQKEGNPNEGHVNPNESHGNPNESRGNPNESHGNPMESHGEKESSKTTSASGILDTLERELNFGSQGPCKLGSFVSDYIAVDKCLSTVMPPNSHDITEGNTNTKDSNANKADSKCPKDSCTSNVKNAKRKDSSTKKRMYRKRNSRRSQDRKCTSQTLTTKTNMYSSLKPQSGRVQVGVLHELGTNTASKNETHGTDLNQINHPAPSHMNVLNISEAAAPLIGQPQCLRLAPSGNETRDSSGSQLQIEDARHIPLAEFYLSKMPQPRPTVPGYVVFKLPPEVVQNMNFQDHNEAVNANNIPPPEFNLLNPKPTELPDVSQIPKTMRLNDQVQNSNNINNCYDPAGFTDKKALHQSRKTASKTSGKRFNRIRICNNNINHIDPPSETFVSNTINNQNLNTANSDSNGTNAQSLSAGVLKGVCGPSMTELLNADSPAADLNNNCIDLVNRHSNRQFNKNQNCLANQNLVNLEAQGHTNHLPLYTASCPSPGTSKSGNKPSDLTPAAPTYIQRYSELTSTAPSYTEQYSQSTSAAPSYNAQYPELSSSAHSYTARHPELAHMEGELKQELYTLIEKINQPGSEVDTAVRVLMHRKSMQEAAGDEEGDGLASLYSPKKPKKSKAAKLPTLARRIMERWYEQNIGSPYPSMETAEYIAHSSGISVEQVKKWFANKRMRSGNTRKISQSVEGASQKRPPAYHDLQCLAKRIKHQHFPQQPGLDD